LRVHNESLLVSDKVRRGRGGENYRGEKAAKTSKGTALMRERENLVVVMEKKVAFQHTPATNCEHKTG